jgi:ComF family protein
MIPAGLRDLAGSLFDLLFPPSCAICQELLPRPAPPVCPACRDAFEHLDGELCDCCGQPVGKPGRCMDCPEEDPQPSRIRSAGPFGGILQDAVLRLKRDRKMELAPVLARFVADAKPDLDLPGQDFLVPVPLHRSRLARRGFNQSIEIARALSKILDLSLDTGHLVRWRDTPSQFQMKDKKAREQNVAGAFRVRPSHPFGDRRVCLVDDVVTTGATLKACAAALRQAGAKSVVALTVARTVQW